MGASDIGRALDAPAPGESVYEPHVAVDPNEPNRVAAVVMYGVPGCRGGRSLWSWVSDDAGHTWAGGRVPLARFDGEGAADGLVAYGADGALLVLGMAVPKALSDAAAAMGSRRGSAPTLDEHLQQFAENPDAQAFLVSDTMSVARSNDHGRSWSATMVPNSPGDKTAMAVDTHPGSPHRGNVYVAWGAHTGALAVAASRAGGRTFDPGEEISGRYGHATAQIAVTPEGAVHVLWTVSLHVSPDAPAEAATAVWHAVSGDGGRSYSTPRIVARHAGTGMIGLPALGATPSGELLLVWGQGSQRPPGEWQQVRHQLVCIHSADGMEWSEPTPLLDNTGVASFMGLPAVAATDSHWYVLAYNATEQETEVVLFRASHPERRFERWRTLARRPIGGDDIYLHGNYMLRRCDDVVQVGDYVGLAGAGATVASVFTLPATDDWESTVTAYAAVLHE